MPASQTLVDSVNIFVEDKDVTLITAIGSITNTFTGSDITNTLHKGGMFAVVITSAAVATATVRVQVQGKDGASGQYYNVASLSVDATSLTTTAGGIGVQTICVYPGAVGGNATIVAGIPLPRVYRCVASVTFQATTTATGLITLGIGVSKLV